MMRPSSLFVFALKFLQKSMMLTPCGPSAVPTGGAGVALPAAIWSFTIACTFFAIAIPRIADAALRRRLPSEFLYLQKIEFDRRRTTEDRHHHFQRVAIEIHLVHHAVEAREGTFVDPYLVALFKRVLRLRLLGRLGHLVEDLIHFLARERRGLRPGTDEPRDLRCVLHHVPRVIRHVHLDQDVAGKEPLGADDLLAAAHLGHLLGGDQDLADLLLKPIRLDAL